MSRMAPGTDRPGGVADRPLAAPPPRSEGTPPRHPQPPAGGVIGPLEATLRRPLLVAIPILLLVGVAFAVGMTREPTYSAETRLNVGRPDVSPEAIGSAAVGNQSLASAYARVIEAEAVVAPVAEGLALEPGDVRARLTASPVPESPIISVRATGSKADEAVRLANAGAARLVEYVRSLGRDESDEADILRRYRSARLAAARARARRDRLEAADALAGESAARQRSLSRANADIATSELQAESLADAYRQAQSSRAAGDLVQVLTPAAGASSDARSALQRLLLLAGAVGLVTGVGLAVVLANRRRGPSWTG